MSKQKISARIEQSLCERVEELAGKDEISISNEIEKLLDVGIRLRESAKAENPLSKETQLAIVYAALNELDRESGGRIYKFLTSKRMGSMSFTYLIIAVIILLVFMLVGLALGWLPVGRG